MPARPTPEPSSLRPALDALVPDLQKRLSGSLDGFTGMILRAHLPQRWVFVTEKSTASLIVTAEGRVSAEDGAVATPDVTIETTFARLDAALRTRDRTQVPPGPLKVTPHTEKGRRAFEFLRSRVGL
ncbi:MAG: hypothetical protein L3J95_05830 [Thermoplasmata archaeon]|nr:hypothetical protein [Thermoplasmata archaeon]MCI4359916.1 hypothetical protein [Thermoplasmata archaeon]